MLGRISLLLLLTLSSLTAAAQKVRSVSGECTYCPPENVTLEQAKQMAVERARIDAIAREFGTNVSQMNTVATINSNGESATAFNSLGSTEVNGDWLADTKEPEIEIDYESGMLAITARVWGKARERKTADFELSVKLLCNGTESEKFRNNDRFSIRFRSPVKGYLSIYLVDDNLRQAYCLLPYETEDGEAREIRNNAEYVLLSTEDPLYPYREETILTTENEVDFNRIVLVFSTNRFVMPLTEQGTYLPELPTPEFDRWLQRCRTKDTAMYVMQKTIEIRK